MGYKATENGYVFSPEYYSIRFTHEILLTKHSVEQQLTEEEKVNGLMENLTKKGKLSAKLKLIEKMKAILGLKEITEEQLDLLFTISGRGGLRARKINMQHLTTEQKQELNLDGLKLNEENTNE